MEIGPQSHIRDGLLGPNSTMVVFMDPVGFFYTFPASTEGSV